MRGANLRGAHLEDAYLAFAHLQRADLWYAHLEGANLWYAHFEGADLEKAVGLTQRQLNVAFGDDRTELPEGLTRPAHWSAVPPDAPGHAK